MNAENLKTHLATGTTHVCTCWSIVRRDGVTIGFTDHDAPLHFDGITFEASKGLSARALSSNTGLAVNNTEAMGVLQSDAITERDIAAGRYDDATVTIWAVQWDAPEARQIRFAGSIGEITRASGGFQAELRGQTDKLNQPQGRSYLKTCSAVLGDAACGFDLSTVGFRAEGPVLSQRDAQVYTLGGMDDFNERWFEGGLCRVMSGAAQGLSGMVKLDQTIDGLRQITLWEPIRDVVAVGDVLHLTAGCDKRTSTCRQKFDNLINFRGFPEIPGQDWLVSVPRSGDTNAGGSLTR